ncbi:MAG: hypothetical protein R3C39_05475 [Dehalococcoidia bacterium]
MNRYIEDMSREELVEEVVDLLRRGVFHHHEVFDPTILPREVLCQNVKRLRLRMLREHRVDIAETEAEPPSEDGRADE